MQKTSHHLIIDLPDGRSVQMDFLQVKKAAVILRAINHPIRQEILRFLKTKQQATVGDIIGALEREQAVVSQHLALLRRAGAVSTRREGRFIVYFLNVERLIKLQQHVVGIIS